MAGFYDGIYDGFYGIIWIKKTGWLVYGYWLYDGMLNICLWLMGFHSHGATSKIGWFISGKIREWMMTFGVVPCLGNLHLKEEKGDGAPSRVRVQLPEKNG